MTGISFKKIEKIYSLWVSLILAICIAMLSCESDDGLVTGPPLEELDSAMVDELLKVGLPIIRIETVNGVVPSYELADPPEGCWGGSIKNATKVPGRLVKYVGKKVVYNSGEYFEKQEGITIKVRGNWSARRPQKPYKIKLQSKADLLNRRDKRFEDKDWLLMPFFNLNSFIGFKVNEFMDLQWTPQLEFVNLVINGEYQGLYMLTESVERNSDCRLDVDKKTGYIVELDAYWWNEDKYVNASFDEPLNYTFKYPDDDDLTQDKLDYIQNVVSEAEQSTRDGSYENRIDVESFARWMLAHDILGNSDGAGSNMFFTKYDDSEMSLLKMGCLWDFDVIMESEGWDEIHDRYFFKGLFASTNRSFANRYVGLWTEKKDFIFSRLEQSFDGYLSSDLCRFVDASIEMNNRRWRAEFGDVPSSATLIDKARVYFNKRKEWLNDNINEMGKTHPSYP